MGPRRPPVECLKELIGGRVLSTVDPRSERRRQICQPALLHLLRAIFRIAFHI